MSRFSASFGHEENLQKQVLQLNIYMKQDLDKQDQLEQKLQALHPACTFRITCSALFRFVQCSFLGVRHVVKSSKFRREKLESEEAKQWIEARGTACIRNFEETDP